MSRRLILPSATSGTDDEMRELARQLLLMSKVADQTFASLTAYISSLESRVVALSKKIIAIKSETKNNANNRSRSRSYSNVRGGGTGQSMDKSICLSSFGSHAGDGDSYRIFSTVRPLWIHELYNAETMHRMPPLHLLDEYLDPAIIGRLGSCAKCYSNPDFFIERWQSQQEARVAELHREKKARKAERKERKSKQEEKKRNMLRTSALGVGEEGKVSKESGGIVSSAAGASNLVPSAATNIVPVVDSNHTNHPSSSTTPQIPMPIPISSPSPAMIPLPPKPKPAVMTSTDISNDSRRHRYRYPSPCAIPGPCPSSCPCSCPSS